MLSQLAAAVAAASGAGSLHPAVTDRALGHPVGAQTLPDAVEPLLEREPAATDGASRMPGQAATHRVAARSSA